MKTFAFLMVIFLAVGLQETTFGQEEKPNRPYIYMSEYQIPWSRVDSLVKILDLFEKEYKWREKAIELGYILDLRVMMHDTGNEWNYRVEWVYPSWEAIRNPGWGMKVWEAVEPDSAKREVYFAAIDWIFKDVIHQDQIYRLHWGAR
jgi:hypothetical protein